MNEHDEDWAGLLGPALRPVQPADAAGLWSRIGPRLDGGWKACGPGLERRTLHRDARSWIFLLKLEAGAMLAAHEHSGDEEAFCLSGELDYDDGRHFAAGDFEFSPAGSRHVAMRSPRGCTLYVRLAIQQ